VAEVPGSTAEMVAAAWLHDTVEDTGVTATDIHMNFGPEVAALVGWLTDVSKPEDGNRAHRKAMDRAHTAEAPAEAQTVKLADLISNSRSIMAHDPAFARTYLEEKRLMLEVMTRGDRGLHAEASRFVGV
jgi:(p)ppGpp synthase/HD superfamily hydrolase